ncbi:hypothetical protein, partial [Catenulispora pinisilvae]|uniref:hypothetical protein n=1 Tax=Catenulispora pinisilvae TaxID=2705253 RepID=UPI00189206F5
SGERAGERPALLAFNVGIVRVTGNGFGGAGLARTWALTGHPAVRRRLDRLATDRPGADRPAGAAPLAVVVATPLYADLCDEGLDRRGWREIRAAGAWMNWGTR